MPYLACSRSTALLGFFIAAAAGIGAAGAQSAHSPSPDVQAIRVWRYEHQPVQAKQKSEIVAYDDRTDTLWVAGVVGIDVLSRAFGTRLDHIDVTHFGAVNSVAIHDGLAALAVEAAPDRTQPGVVLLFDTRTRQRLGDPVAVGVLPDMLTFSPNGQTILVANEGTPNERAAGATGATCPADPAGGVSLIDVRTRQVKTLTLDPALPGYTDLRLFPASLCPYDPEPEYIAIDKSGQAAWVGLQEANGLALLDLKQRRFERIVGLGVKDFNQSGAGLDPSDRDGVTALRTLAVKGLYQPDAIATYEHDGKTYLVMANEGDARDNGLAESEDERRGSTFGAGAPLDRLNLSSVDSATGNLVAFGGRSFSIRDSEGRIIFDSGDELDREAIRLGIYDDGRSDNKGTEPEGVALMHVNGRVLAFIGLERTTKSAVAVYDVTDPRSVRFKTMIVGESDRAPEGLITFHVGSRHYLAVANETSDTTSLFEIGLR